MSPDQLVQSANTKFKSATERFKSEINKLRTGRAHPSMLDGITAEAYGQQMPLIQLATISAPEAQLLQITPFDPNSLKAITSSIRDNQSLGMNPTDDGRIIRVPIPPLNEERRKQIVKQLHEKVEETLIAFRNTRRDALQELDQAKKDKDIGEDEHKRYAAKLEESMTSNKNALDSLAKAKESEIMTV